MSRKNIYNELRAHKGKKQSKKKNHTEIIAEARIKRLSLNMFIQKKKDTD